MKLAGGEFAEQTRTRPKGRAGWAGARAWMWIGLAAFAAATVAGTQTARQADQVRGLYQQLSDHRKAQDDHLREYRLLLLERATFAGAQNVAPLATEQLQMRFPAEVVPVWR